MNDTNEIKTEHQVYIFEGISKTANLTAKKVTVEVYARSMSEAMGRMRSVGITDMFCIPKGNVKAIPSLPGKLIGSPTKWRGSVSTSMEWSIKKNPLKALR